MAVRRRERIAPGRAVVGVRPSPLAQFTVTVPDTPMTIDVDLVVELVDEHGASLASSRLPCAIVPSDHRRTRPTLKA